MKDSYFVLAIVIILILLVIGGVGTFVYLRRQEAPEPVVVDDTPVVLPPIDEDTGTGFETGPRPQGSTNIWTNIYRCEFEDDQKQVIGNTIFGITVLDEQTLHLMHLHDTGRRPPAFETFSMAQNSASNSYTPSLYAPISFRTLKDGVYSTPLLDMPLKKVVEEDGKINLKIGLGGDKWTYLWPLMKPEAAEGFDAGANINQTVSGCYYTEFTPTIAEFFVFYKQNDYMLPGKENTYKWPYATRIHVQRKIQNNSNVQMAYDGENVWSEIATGKDEGLLTTTYHLISSVTGQMIRGTCITLSQLSDTILTCDQAGASFPLIRITKNSSAALQMSEGQQAWCRRVENLKQFPEQPKFNLQALKQAELVEAGCIGGFAMPLSPAEYKL